MFSDSAVDTHCLISGKYVPFKKGVDGKPDKPAHTSRVDYCLTQGQLETGLTELYEKIECLARQYPNHQVIVMSTIAVVTQALCNQFSLAEILAVVRRYIAVKLWSV